MREVKSKKFKNGAVYALMTQDGYPIEVTDTFLPFYTKDATGKHQNKLTSGDLGSRAERWMIGVSCMSGCPIGCTFCATGKLKKWRNLSAQEIINQLIFIQCKNPEISPKTSKEFKINYTRMGEPFLNIYNVKSAIKNINNTWPNTHHYISTIGIKDSDFSWIKGNISLQISLHSLEEERRNKLIPYNRKMLIEELGKIRTISNLKTTVNLTLADLKDWDIKRLREYFDPKYFFIKISPINENEVGRENNMGSGIIEGINLI